MNSDIIKKIMCGDTEGFNLWREYYNKLTFNEHKQIINHWYSLASSQRWAHPSFFIWAFRQLTRLGIDLSEMQITELGSADGWLAYNCLTKIGFKNWVGYDISSTMVEQTLPEAENLGFINTELYKQFWESNVEEFDIFVSSHTIEHLSDDHCKELLDFLSHKAKMLILEIYVKGNRVDWNNYTGSHILTLSGNDINGMIKDRGFVSLGKRYMGWLKHPFTGLHTFKDTGFNRIGSWKNHFVGVYIKNFINNKGDR